MPLTIQILIVGSTEGGRRSPILMSDDPTLHHFPRFPVNRFARLWLTATEQAFENVLAAQRAALTAARLTWGSDAASGRSGAVAYSDPRWEIERSISDSSTVRVGDRVTFSKQITETDIEWFASASGDTSRLHLDPSYASESRFGGRIAHGTLVAGLISAALARFPGTTVYLSQDMAFLHPVEIGDVVRSECVVIEDLGNDRFRLSTKVFVNDDVQVIDGEAEVLIDNDLSETA